MQAMPAAQQTGCPAPVSPVHSMWSSRKSAILRLTITAPRGIRLLVMPFGAGDHVGLDAVVLGGEPRAGAPEPGHDLVVDQQDVVLVEEGADLGPVVVRRHQQAVGAGDALGEHGGDVLRPFHLDDFLDVAHALPVAGVDRATEGAAIAVGVEDPDYRRALPAPPASAGNRRRRSWSPWCRRDRSGTG